MGLDRCMDEVGIWDGCYIALPLLACLQLCPQLAA